MRAGKPNPAEAVVRLRPEDLPAHCPGDNTALWCSHPKVYVAISEADGDSWLCPYCGTRFVMESGSTSKAAKPSR